jgi:hypothetical protein
MKVQPIRYLSVRSITPPAAHDRLDADGRKWFARQLLGWRGLTCQFAVLDTQADRLHALTICDRIACEADKTCLAPIGQAPDGAIRKYRLRRRYGGVAASEADARISAVWGLSKW